MNEGQTTVSLPVYILQDHVPEFDEAFTVTLSPNKDKDGYVIGENNTCTIVILENDYPYGVIGTKFNKNLFSIIQTP